MTKANKATAAVASRPHRIPGCSGLLWPVAEIRRVLGLEVAQ